MKTEGPYRVLICPLCRGRCVGEFSLVLHVWEHLLGEVQFHRLRKSIGNLHGCVCFCGMVFSTTQTRDAMGESYMSAMSTHWLGWGGYQEHLLADVLFGGQIERGEKVLVNRSLPF